MKLPNLSLVQPCLGLSLMVLPLKSAASWFCRTACRTEDQAGCHLRLYGPYRLKGTILSNRHASSHNSKHSWSHYVSCGRSTFMVGAFAVRKGLSGMTLMVGTLMVMKMRLRDIFGLGKGVSKGRGWTL